jgi:hypothetical protein
MLGLAGVMRVSALTKEIQMCVNQAAPVEPNVEDPSVLDRVSPTSTYGWRITPSHALRC